MAKTKSHEMPLVSKIKENSKVFDTYTNNKGVTWEPLKDKRREFMEELDEDAKWVLYIDINQLEILRSGRDMLVFLDMFM